MKSWYFLIGWVIFWMINGRLAYPRYLDLSNFCIIIAIVGGGTMLIYAMMEITIKMIGG